ncbi:tyrosine-type recombinase/integrase [Methylocystis sp. JAN1]|uniref:tyrosine-type recombinase/integrase n=1 Tax=Methylocystis sp. JAN1 TaxID=3397211 RepID=UPI003FA24D25
MPLSDAAIRAAKPRSKVLKLSDGGGLQLWVLPSGVKSWNFAYRFAGKQKKLTIGQYPAIGLKEARSAREDAKRLLALSQDPGQQKRLDKANKAAAEANTFRAIAAELLDKKRREGLAKVTLEKFEWLLAHVAPTLGKRPIGEISAAEVLAAIRPVEMAGKHETAVRIRGRVGEVFRYAIATGRCENDPTIALRGALVRPKPVHRAAILAPAPFGALLRAIDGYSTVSTRIALQLLALTFVRPGELRHAEWSEFDLQRRVWEIPAGKMKMRRPHRVPLAQQAVALLEELRPLTGHGRYLFPSERSRERPISENTLNAALRRLDFSKDEMTSHGFRAAASTMLNESGKWNSDAIEAQLAHVEKNAVRRAYARGEHWDERVKMMEWWAGKLDALRSGGEVIFLTRTVEG